MVMFLLAFCIALYYNNPCLSCMEYNLSSDRSLLVCAYQQGGSSIAPCAFVLYVFYGEYDINYTWRPSNQKRNFHFVLETEGTGLAQHSRSFVPPIMYTELPSVVRNHCTAPYSGI